MTKVSSARHVQVIFAALGSAAGRYMAGMRILVIEDEPRILAFLAARPGGGGLLGRRRRRRAGRRQACGGRRLRPRDPRPPSAEARRLRGAARAPEQAAGATRRNRLGALRARDEAPRVRPRRLRLPLEAVLVRRAARARACPAPA